MDLPLAEAVLRRDEQRYRSLVQATTAMVWNTPASGEFETDQPGWSKFTGQSFEQLRGWGWLNAVHPDDRPNTAKVWSAAVASRSMYVVEHRLRRHDGQYRHMMVRAVPILDKDGSIREWIGLHTDIDDRKRAEEELRRARDAAASANRIKSEFLANMSHELRTPLNSVIGFANILLKNKAGNLRPQDLDYLQRIRNNGQHLLGLINQVLDLSKVEAGRMEAEVASVDLTHLIRETLGELTGQAAAKNILLQGDVPIGLPPLETDAEKLKQVVINLVGNALKFTEKGSVSVRVRMDPDHPESTLIEVADTGIGIPEDKLETIFEAFRQAETSTARKFGGTGLGLTISRAICRLLGGDLTVSSTFGEGTTFQVRLPERLATPISSVLPNASQCVQEGSMLLVVDDDADTRDLLTVWLREANLKVQSARDGHEALRLLERYRPDLVLLDLSMPRVNGWEFLDQLRRWPHGAGLHVVVIAGQDLVAADRERLAERNAAVIFKDGRLFEELQRTVRTVLGNPSPRAHAIGASPNVAGEPP
ncbi:MAG: ATP-binding protein [Gemmataceae bacterium]